MFLLIENSGALHFWSQNRKTKNDSQRDFWKLSCEPQHPGESTAGTQKWRWMEDDFPFQFVDF